MSELLIDAETYSEIDVRKVGSYVYANHPSTRVILWSVRDPEWPRSLVFEEPNIWKLLLQLKQTKQIEWTRNEPLGLIHWSPFDRHIAQYATPRIAEIGDEWDEECDEGAVAGPNNTYWSDLADMSLIYGGPMKLKNAAAFWSNSQTKDEGKHLIARFCKPQTDGTLHDKASDPIRWEQFRAYAGQDTNVMVPILERFAGLGENGGEDFMQHWPGIVCVNKMNREGVPIDITAARDAASHLLDAGHRAAVKCEREYGFKPTNVKQIGQYLGLPDCQKETVEDFLEEGVGTKEQLALAQLRLLSSGVASKKVIPMIHHAGPDDRVRDCFIYHGAWTGRLTSVAIQFQNMLGMPSDETFFHDLGSSHYGTEDSDIFADVRQNIRGFILAQEGNTLVSADSNAIECRVAAWLAGEDWLLNVFRTSGDPYLIMASEIYGEDITDKEDPRRKLGKTAELQLQYQSGGEKLQTQCQKRGIYIDLPAAKTIVKTYRKIHPNIVKCWADCQTAFVQCMDAEVGTVVKMEPVSFVRLESAVKLVRPSGFGQYYWLPEMTYAHWDDCKSRYCDGCKDEIQYTGRGKSGVMHRKHTYGGDIFQSFVQGIAADLLRFWMMGLQAEDYSLIMSIHDEVVCEIEDTNKSWIDNICRLLCVLPSWADGLPVKAEGWQQKRFTK